MLPLNWQNSLEEIIDAPILSIKGVSGGDISQSFKIEADNKDYFLKVNNSSSALSMFKAEKKGLELLNTKGAILIPNPLTIVSLGLPYSGLLMPFIKATNTTDVGWNDLARQLSLLHRQSSKNFGLSFDNYIGSLPQKNDELPSWEEFYASQRILPLAKLCRDLSHLNASECNSIYRFCSVINELFPREQPSLLHGDLWSGNFLTTQDQKTIFIDPAPFFGHRELDIAMTQLFGGFSPTFLESYIKEFPMIGNWQERLPYSQLYYLLVHLAMFGRSYHSSVKSIISQF